MSTPQQFAQQGLNIVTEWEQATERLIQFAAVFEARGGMNQFENAKIDPVVTPEDQAYNDSLDELGQQALNIVTHHNELMQWYDAGRRVRVNILRIDY